MDKKTWRVFKGYNTVEDLEKRFTLEDTFVLNDKSIRSKEFYTELNRLVPPHCPKVE